MSSEAIAKIVRRPRKSGRSVRFLKYAEARKAMSGLTPGCEIYCLTLGQFSLIDVLLAVLDQTGPADVDIATWIAADCDLDVVEELLAEAEIQKFRLMVDRSFVKMRPARCRKIEQMFGAGCIRSLRNHSKFIRVKNETWNIAIRTSMNLNQNPRMENLEISDCPTLCEFLESVVDSVFAENEPGNFSEGKPELKSVPDQFQKNLYGDVTCNDTPGYKKLRGSGEVSVG